MTKIKAAGMEALAKQTANYPQEQLLRVQKKGQQLLIGIPKERAMQEMRVGLTPQAVALLINRGHRVVIERGAGKDSRFLDSEYSESGGEIVDSAEQAMKADIVMKVEPPTVEEIDMMKNGAVLISAIQVGNLAKEVVTALIQKKITAVAFEMIQDKVGGMPAVRAMSEIAGSNVMMIAAEYLSIANSGRGVILGGITGVPPTKVVIIGAGTVAEYSARVATALGAEVKVFDNHLYKLRGIRNSLGPHIYTSTIDTLTLQNAVADTDVLIGALFSDKGRTPCVVTEEMVQKMKPGAVIVDVSIDQGGCVETSSITSHKKPTFKKYDVIHYCVPNIASRVPRTASIAMSNILTPYFIEMEEQGGVEDMIFQNEWFMKGVYLFKGILTCEHIATKFGLKHRDMKLIMAAKM